MLRKCIKTHKNPGISKKYRDFLLAEKEGFEFPQVITFYNKNLQYITKYMRFRNFLVALLTTVYYPISLLYHKQKWSCRHPA